MRPKNMMIESMFLLGGYVKLKFLTIFYLINHSTF